MEAVPPEEWESMRLTQRKLGWGVVVFVAVGVLGISTLWTSDKPVRVLGALGGLAFLVVAGLLWQVRRTVTRVLARAEEEPTGD